jgi:tetratricopeptide (TPR) repeat protein
VSGGNAFRLIAGNALIAGGALLLALDANAGTASAAGNERASAPLWSEIGRPREQRAHELLLSARAHEQEAERTFPGEFRAVCNRALESAPDSESLASLRGRGRALHTLARQALRRRAQLDAALDRLDRALALAPDDGEVLYARARVLASWEDPGPSWTCESTRRDAEAIAAYETLQNRHPELAPAAVAFELAVALTRSRRFADAARAYQRASSLALDGDNGGTVLSNLAEMTMLAGDLQGAVDNYERALQGSSGGRDYLLALWGLSVALDRLGEHQSALDHAQKALHAEGWSAQVLRSDGVFFEPPNELHYYEGLAHEALAAHDDAARAHELRAATVSYRAFLAGAGEHGSFTQAGQAALERVQAEAKAAPRTKAKAAAALKH